MGLVVWSSLAANAASSDLSWLVERRVRIQSPALGPGWHQGLFNRQRREPPCYVVLTFKPRPSPDSPLKAGVILQLQEVSLLQSYSGRPSSMSEWAGRQSAELADDSLWKPVPRDVLRANRTC